MDALDVFYRIRHDQGLFDELLTNLRYVFATGSHFEALACVSAQCCFVMRHRGFRPAGRAETGAMVGSVTTAAEALSLCASHRPQLLITTDQLEDGDGLELVRQAHQHWPQMPILVVLKQVSLPRLRAALQAGAQGVLTDVLVMEGHVLTAIQSLLRGEPYLDPSLGLLLEQGGRGWDPQLSAKQLAILQLVVNGRTDREIAAELAIPFDTVRHQLKQAYRELGINNRSHAVLVLLQLGLLQPPALPAVARADVGPALASLRSLAADQPREIGNNAASSPI
jgi:DNA-binding NarL/FixJ family response regulator